MYRKALTGPGPNDGKEVPEQLKNCDPKLVEMISNEMMSSPGVTWDEIGMCTHMNVKKMK